MKIANFEIGTKKVFIIAELSANHAGSKELAKKSIVAAKRAGADAVKLQTYTPDTITINCEKDDFLLNQGTIWDGQTLYDLYKEAYTPWEWHSELFETAIKAGIICFSSPFDKTAVDLLEELECPAYKIASFEITDIPLIKYVASKGKPVILSTGISSYEDIKLAVETCKGVGNDQIIILKTTSQYPAKIEDANLRMIPDIARQFNVVTGLSDHTRGDVVPVVSVALGAAVIEKHFILDKSIKTPDTTFSLDEEEFYQMVTKVREAERSLGNIDYSLTEKMKISRQFARSLYVIKDLKKGDVLTEENVRSIRPGFGMHPKYLDEILGNKVNIDVDKGTRLSKDIFY